MADRPLPSRTVRVVLALDRLADRRGFLPAVSFFPLADYVLLVLPNQMLLLLLSVLRPQRWRSYAAVFVLAGGVGALLSAWAVQAIGPWLIDFMFGGAPDDGTAADIMEMIRLYGLAGLILLAALPWPPRTAVILCAIAGLSPLAIGLAVGAGRITPVLLCALLGARAPHLLKRMPRVGRVLGEVEALRRPA